MKEAKPKITVIGGGTGLPILLSGLKADNWDITAIVTVADDGGSSGTIRTALNTIPPGDIRNCLVALSDTSQTYKDVFQYRFAPKDNQFSGHAVGNLIIAALAERRDIHSALKIVSKSMNVKGKVLPVSETPLILQAHCLDGTIIEGETKIVAANRAIDYVTTHRVGDPQGEQPVFAGRQVVKAIKEADVLVLGPGSLYTSILPNLTIPEVREAIDATDATVLYVCNIMTQMGETEHFSDRDHLAAVNKHLGQHKVDVMLTNSSLVPTTYIEDNEMQDYLIQVTHDEAGLAAEAARIVEKDLLDLKESGVYHNQRKLVDAIRTIYEEGEA
ncbi:MAG: uridine diphosphate-N-acetylglucosamine-binding protein YvcK [Aerococcus sp.]|nr:uridine diphosphate-N-acetylglucosamine-binding protein YvcK [Aerococcus sp.]